MIIFLFFIFFLNAMYCILQKNKISQCEFFLISCSPSCHTIIVLVQSAELCSGGFVIGLAGIWALKTQHIDWAIHHLLACAQACQYTPRSRGRAGLRNYWRLLSFLIRSVRAALSSSRLHALSSPERCTAAHTPMFNLSLSFQTHTHTYL